MTAPSRDRTPLLALPAVAYLGLVYAAPILYLLGRSLVGPQGLTLEPYFAFFADPFNLRVIGNTLRIALLVTLVCLLIGYPVAFALARARGFAQVALFTAIVLPLSVGVVVKAFAWQIVLRRDGGSQPE
jgi:putative spermidine/putrescine transport system permease protein